jgi:uncharacterized protein YcbX
VTDLTLSTLTRYPLKSARGESLQQLSTDHFGLAGDRRWMLVDEEGKFLSQRQLPQLCLLDARSGAGDGELLLSWHGQSTAVPRPAADAEVLEVTIWSDRVHARLAAAQAGAWLSDRLGQAVRLVYLPDSARRAADPDFAPHGDLVSFADGFPLLVIGQSSLEDLNRRLPSPVPMDRFRPNLVIKGAKPFEEDRWRRLRVGDATLSLVKPCSRCVVPSIDQGTAERDPAINRVLAAYRRRDGVIYFGVNALVPPGVLLQCGDPVEILH